MDEKTRQRIEDLLMFLQVEADVLRDKAFDLRAELDRVDKKITENTKRLIACQTLLDMADEEGDS